MDLDFQGLKVAAAIEAESSRYAHASELGEHQAVQLLVLALLRAAQSSILNSHPSFLPSSWVHRQVAI